MSNFWYDEATRQLSDGTLDLDTADLRVLLVMSNTTAGTERSKTTMGGGTGFTTLDEFNGANYASPGLALAGRSLSVNGVSHRTEIPATASSWTALGAGSRAITAAIVYKFVAALATSIPIAWIDTGGFPITASGADLTVTWNAAGMLQVGPST